MEKTSDKIRKLRISKNLTQQQLADQLHVTKQAISKWEQGKCVPDVTSIELIATFFGVSTDYLINDSIEKVEPEVTVTSPNPSKQMNKLTVVLASALAVMLAAVIALSIALGASVNKQKPDKPVEVNGLVITYLADNTVCGAWTIEISLNIYNSLDHNKDLLKSNFTIDNSQLSFYSITPVTSVHYSPNGDFYLDAHTEVTLSVVLSTYSFLSELRRHSVTLKYAGQPIGTVKW